MNGSGPTIEEGIAAMVSALQRAKQDPYARISRMFFQTGKLRRAVFAPVLCHLWDLDRRHFNLTSKCRTYQAQVIEAMTLQGTLVPTKEDPYRTFWVHNLPEEN